MSAAMRNNMVSRRRRTTMLILSMFLQILAMRVSMRTRKNMRITDVRATVNRLHC